MLSILLRSCKFEKQSSQSHENEEREPKVLLSTIDPQHRNASYLAFLARLSPSAVLAVPMLCLRLTRQGAIIAVAHWILLSGVVRLAHQHIVRRHGVVHGVDRFVTASAPEGNVVPLQQSWALHALCVIHVVAAPGACIATTRRIGPSFSCRQC
jgi:hypothetical protein